MKRIPDHQRHSPTVSRLGRRHFLALSGAGLGCFCGGCAVNPATGEQQMMLMSADEERRIGASEHPKILQEFGGAYDDPRVSGYVATIGGRLATATEAPDIPFSFTVLNSPIVNAMALPGGYVYITRGLLALAQNEAEVAGVIGHEIGHVIARHTASRVSRAQAAQIGLLGLSILGSVAGLPSGLGQVAGTVAQLHLQGFSRDQEFEADMLGVRYMTRIGYDPSAMASFLGQLRANSSLQASIEGRPADSVDKYDIMATHPRTVDRIERATAAAGVAPGQGQVRQREIFLKAIDGMVFGESPDQGLTRGREFIHRSLRFRFEVPEGFRIINRPDAVIAKDNSLGAAIVFDMDRRSAGGSMPAYLVRGWAQAQLNEVEALTVNGMPAATGWLRGNTNQGTMVVRLLAIEAEPNLIFRFLFLGSPLAMQRLAVPFRRTTYSFRRISPAEAAGIKAKVIDLHIVRAGENAAGLARRMNVDSHALGWFEVLNGLVAGRELATGTTIKLVS